MEVNKRGINIDEIFNGLGKLVIENIDIVRHAIEQLADQKNNFTKELIEELEKAGIDGHNELYRENSKSEYLNFGIRSWLLVWKKSKPSLRVLIDLSCNSFRKDRILLYLARTEKRQQVFKRKEKKDEISLKNNSLNKIVQEIVNKVKSLLEPIAT